MANTRRGKKRWSLYRIRRAAPKKSRKKEQHIRNAPLGRGLFNISDGLPSVATMYGPPTRSQFTSLQPKLATLATLAPLTSSARLKYEDFVTGKRVNPLSQSLISPRSPRSLLRNAEELNPPIGFNPLDNERIKAEVIATIEKAAEQISRAPNYGQRYFDIKQGALALEWRFKKLTQPNPFNDDNIDIESLNAWNNAKLPKEQHALPSIHITNNIMTLYVIRAPNRYKNIKDRITAYRNHKEKISNHLNYVIELVIEQKKAAIQENFVNLTTVPHFKPVGRRVGEAPNFKINEKRSKFPLGPPIIDESPAIGTLINPYDIAPAIPISEVSTERMTSFLPAVFIKILETKVEEKIREAEANLDK
jgi:hypothetical protein